MSQASLKFGPEVDAILEDDSSLETRWRYLLRYLQVRQDTLSYVKVPQSTLKYFQVPPMILPGMCFSMLFNRLCCFQGRLNQDIDSFREEQGEEKEAEEEGRSVVIMTFHPSITDTTGKKP